MNEIQAQIMIIAASALEEKTLLELTGIAAVISVAGSLFGHFLKEWVFARLFESWKSKRAVKQSFTLLLTPMAQSACDLLTRLHEIRDKFPPEFLEYQALESPSPELERNDTTDPHYRHYKLVSTLYRFCAFWGWVELFRRDVASILETQHKQVVQIETQLDKLRIDLADGTLNEEDDWEMWRDRLVFREELRAIGERIIAPYPQRGVIGYAAFSDLLKKKPIEEWLTVAVNFFINLGSVKDYRVVRIDRMITRLHDLLEALDWQNVPSHIKAKRRWEKSGSN